MPDYQALIANCLMVGEELTTVSPLRQVRNLIRLSLDGYQVELVQAPALITANKDELKGRTIHTTDLFVRGVEPEKLPALEILSRNVAELLSFATVSDVVCYGYNFPAGNQLGEQRSFTGVTHYFRPVIETRDGTEVKNYLERCYPAYNALRDTRRLNVALRYHGLANAPGLPAEAVLVFTFVLLEHLKHQFAVSQNYAKKKDHFLQPTLPGQKKPLCFTFSTLLETMFKATGMNPALGAAVTLRNELIHSGLSAADGNVLWAMFDEIQDWIREYLLRTLGFKGTYHACTRGKSPVI